MDRANVVDSMGSQFNVLRNGQNTYTANPILRRGKTSRNNFISKSSISNSAFQRFTVPHSINVY